MPKVTNLDGEVVEETFTEADAYNYFEGRRAGVHWLISDLLQKAQQVGLDLTSVAEAEDWFMKHGEGLQLAMVAAGWDFIDDEMHFAKSKGIKYGTD